MLKDVTKVLWQSGNVNFIVIEKSDVSLASFSWEFDFNQISFLSACAPSLYGIIFRFIDCFDAKLTFRHGSVKLSLSDAIEKCTEVFSNL